MVEIEDSNDSELSRWERIRRKVSGEIKKLGIRNLGGENETGETDE